MTEAANNVSMKKNNKFALTGFVIGILSIFLFVIGALPLVGIIISIIGVLTYKKKIHKNKWMAITGLTLSLIFISVNVWIFSDDKLSLKFPYGNFSKKGIHFPAGVSMESNKAYARANELFSNNQQSLGIAELKKAIDEGYRNPLAFMRVTDDCIKRAMLHEGLNYNSKAIEILESYDIKVMYPNEIEIIKKKKGSLMGEAFSQTATIYFMQHDFDNAKTYIEKALSISPKNTNASARDLKGRIALSEKRYDVAIQIYKSLLEDSPRFIQGKLFLGEALIKSGNTDEGINILKQFIKELPDNNPLSKKARKLISSLNKNV